MAIQAINYLGTVHERYGQVGLAAIVFWKGWELSVNVLGDDSFMSLGFAKKLGDYSKTGLQSRLQFVWACDASAGHLVVHLFLLPQEQRSRTL